MKSFNDFISDYVNQYIDAGGSANALNQCVDLANKYFEEVLGVPKIMGTDAIAFPSKTDNRFQWIVKTENVEPVEGDVLIWKIGTHGHIAMFVRRIDKYKFISFDQNYPIGTPCHLQEHDYKGVIGWLRFKNMPNSQKYEVAKGLYDFLFIENKFTEGDIREGMAIFKSGVVGEFSKRLEEVNKQNSDLKKEIGDLKVSHSQEVSYMVKIATEKLNSELIALKLVLAENEITIKEYHLLLENGIELILRGIKVLLNKFFNSKKDIEITEDSGNNENVK